MLKSLIVTFTLAFMPVSISAAVNVDSVWIAPIAAHTALCTSGTSADGAGLEQAAKDFNVKLSGVTAVGNLYFETITVDETAKTITWRACAPVAAGTRAPADFQSVQVPAQQAIFALCAEAVTTAQCAGATIALLSERVDEAVRPGVMALRARGAKVPAVPTPITDAGRTAVERMLIDPNTITLHPAQDAAANSAAILKDPNVRRRPLAAPPPVEKPEVSEAPPATVNVVAVPFPPDLANALSAAVTQ